MHENLSRSAIFQGVDHSPVDALTKQLQPVNFPRRHTIFAQGEPADRLYIIVSGHQDVQPAVADLFDNSSSRRP